MEFEEAEPRLMSAEGSSISVLDASAVLVLLFDEPGAKQVADAIAEGAALSTVNCSEVATVLARNQRDVERVLRNVREQVALEPFTVDDAIMTAILAEPTRASGLSLGDRACLALAKRLAVRAVTADRKWAELDLAITVHLVRPRS
jgi:PIN domain nuclease of toxin-antitoxin system